jgi:hypothetical protein
VDLYLHSPVCLHGAVLNYLSIGITLPFHLLLLLLLLTSADLEFID